MSANRSPWRWLAALAWLAAVAALGIAVASPAPTVVFPFYARPAPDERAALDACQSFVAEYDGLCRVEVRLSGGIAGDGPDLIWRLRAGERVLAVGLGEAPENGGPAYQAFTFDPLPGSQGQGYTFCLEARTLAARRGVALLGPAGDTYAHGQATFTDGDTAPLQDLDFRLGYRMPLWRAWPFLSARLLAFKPAALGARGLYALLAAAFLGLLGLAFRRAISG
jgi:hypothetical protein